MSTFSSNSLGFAMAQARGIYAKHDLDVKLVEGRGSAVAAQLVATGQVDLGYADAVGDYQRQLFLVDHAGLPLEVVLEQIEILGTEVVPVLRKEFELRRPAHVPSDPPTHATLVAADPEHYHHEIQPASALAASAK